MIGFGAGEMTYVAFQCLPSRRDVIDLWLELTSDAETNRRRAAWRRQIEAAIAARAESRKSRHSSTVNDAVLLTIQEYVASHGWRLSFRVVRIGRMRIVTRADAKTQGLRRYFTGEPCR